MDEIKPLLLLIFSAFFIRQTLIFCGQGWAKSYSQTISFLVLPVITYVITITISGNIALSLGMIGALSIVRFRHPVKSALELVIYFALITIGIATSVRTKWAIQLILCTILIIILVKAVQLIAKKYGKSFYSASFNEGNVSNSLEIVSKAKIDIIEKSDNLVNYFSDFENNNHTYRLNFHNKSSLEDFRERLKNNNNIEKINAILN